MTACRGGERGSVLVWSVLIIAILSMIAAETLRVTSVKYQNALQTASWQESLLASESGVDLAMVELRKSLFAPPNHAWENWTAPPGVDANYSLTTVPNAGLAGTPMSIAVNVDAPPALIDAGNGWQYYRIRAIGTLPLTGLPRVSDNRQDARLRKLSLFWDRFTNGVLVSRPLLTPEVSRRVEAIVRPVSAFDQAIISSGTLDLTNQNIVVDSYDSKDPTKSTNGLYDAGKRQENGDIATDGTLIEAGNAHIYGDVSTNAGTVSGAANITGVERTDFYQELIPVSDPSWPSVNPGAFTVTGTTTLNGTATRGSANSRYILSQIALSGGQVLRLAGNPDGSQTYIEVYVTGDISVSGSAQIVLDPGVTAAIYFDGNVDVAGNGLVNSKNQPQDLQLYGVTPAAGVSEHVKLAGNAQLTAAVYAPGHDVTVNGGGSSGHVFGSIVGKTVTMTGVTNLHYDEALSGSGKINDYKIVSWFEDTR
jgi:hypothetical protein